MNFLSGPHSKDPKVVHTRADVISLQFLSGHPAPAFRALGKGQFLFLAKSSQKRGRKLETFESDIAETRRIQDPVQFAGRQIERHLIFTKVHY